jgi:hypothetical protein
VSGTHATSLLICSGRFCFSVVSAYCSIVSVFANMLISCWVTNFDNAVVMQLLS